MTEDEASNLLWEKWLSGQVAKRPIRTLEAEKQHQCMAAKIMEQAIELKQWRSGKRRVFWRVRKPASVEDFDDKRDAWAAWHEGFRWAKGKPSEKACGVYRVTVHPKVKP